MPTLPGLLRRARCRTAVVVKWHLGFPPHFGPLKSGYEHFYGVLAGGVDSFSRCSSWIAGRLRQRAAAAAAMPSLSS